MGRFSKIETHRPDEPPGDGRAPAGTPKRGGPGGNQPGSAHGQPGAPGRAGADAARPEPAPALATEFTHDAAGHLARGYEVFFSGNEKDGLRWFSKAIQENAGLIEAWVAHGRAQLLLGQAAEALTWVQRAMVIFPDAPVLIALRAAVNARKGMARAAIAACDVALERDNRSPDIWMCRGHALLISENRNADFCFEQAVQLTPDLDWRTPFWIAMLYDSERQWSRSIGYYERALGRRSTLPYACYRIALASSALGRPEAARRALAEADRLCGDNEKLRQKVARANPGSMLRKLANLFGR